MGELTVARGADAGLALEALCQHCWPFLRNLHLRWRLGRRISYLHTQADRRNGK